MSDRYVKIAQLREPAALRDRLSELQLELPVDEQILTADQDSPLANSLQVGSMAVGNRWCIHPMEGWDAQADGSPTEKTLRRWRNFGASGAKLIWGGEAAAVRPDGRANPNQTLALTTNEQGLAALLKELQDAHREHFENLDDLLVGLQLTHSGRFSRPNSKQLEPRIAYHHPLLDEKFQIDPRDDSVVWTDEDLGQLIEDYVSAAVSMGQSNWKIMFKHILPNSLTPIITFAPFAIIADIGTLVSLDFLGYGLQPPASSWGHLLKQGAGNIDNYHLLIFPVIALTLTIFMITFISEAIREAFDPRVYSRLR